MKNTTTLRSFALGLTVMLGMTATALAQSTHGSIRGTVVDPSGALIPHAQVTISNAAGFSRMMLSGATGAYALTNLTPGSYSVSVDAMGFTPALEGGVQVANETVTRRITKLRISVDQEIEVSANADALPATTETGGEVSANSR